MLATTCQALHCLPYGGGLLDQPPQMVTGIRLVLDAINTKTRMLEKRAAKKSKKGSRWNRGRRRRR